MVNVHLPVDLAVLCTIVEKLFGLAIMTDPDRIGCSRNFEQVLRIDEWMKEEKILEDDALRKREKMTLRRPC